jgi:hypothetical protein
VSACAAPISDGALLEWWTGEIPAAARRSVEQHLLACDGCSGRLRLVQELAEGIGSLLRGGELPAAVVPAVVERLRRDGRRIREYSVGAGGAVQCTVSPEDDLVLARLGADLRGVSRLDLVSRLDDGPEVRLADLPFDSEAGELVFFPPVDVLRARPASVERFELRAVSPDGERLLGRYAFHHTPWPGTGSR